ncbi:MAG: hypothetical protein ABR590_03220 [Spirochaetia bacterium]
MYSLLRFGKAGGIIPAAGKTGSDGTPLEVLRPCPLCRTMLRRGERVHTVVYSGASAPRGDARQGASRQGASPRRGEVRDAITHMFGCPYCRPGSSTAAANARICPVCRATLPEDAYVVARMFEREGRKHIHVLGCTECRSGARRTLPKSSTDASASNDANTGVRKE